MTTAPAARTRLVMAACATVLLNLVTVAHAAIPTNAATMTVSATVLPTCNNTDCRDIPRVVRYQPANGVEGQPAFELKIEEGRRIMTVTY